jgi:hypothetical protein
MALVGVQGVPPLPTGSAVRSAAGPLHPFRRVAPAIRWLRGGRPLGAAGLTKRRGRHGAPRRFCVTGCVITLASLPVSERIRRSHSITHTEGSERAENPHEPCCSVSLCDAAYRSPSVSPTKWHGRGHRFDPDQVHQTFLTEINRLRGWFGAESRLNRGTIRAHAENPHSVTRQRDNRKNYANRFQRWPYALGCISGLWTSLPSRRGTVC